MTDQQERPTTQNNVVDDEQRAGVERQGNVMFWVTLSVGAAILIVSVIFALFR